MTQSGSPDQWANFIESQVPAILGIIVDTWEAMPAPAGNEREDPVSEALCRALRRSRSARDLPFRIDTQLVELDPAAGQDQGRMDIVFSPPAPREDIYFCLECKRLNVRDHAPGEPRPYYVEYVRFGMLRFVRGQYSNAVISGGMLGFVLDGDVKSAIAGVEDNVKRLHAELGMPAPGAFLTSSVRPADARIRETTHARPGQSEPFRIHHMFLAGDANAPLRPEAASVEKPRERKKAARRKAGDQ
jgi:hypothetical protein